MKLSLVYVCDYWPHTFLLLRTLPVLPHSFFSHGTLIFYRFEKAPCIRVSLNIGNKYSLENEKRLHLTMWSRLQIQISIVK